MIFSRYPSSSTFGVSKPAKLYRAIAVCMLGAVVLAVLCTMTAAGVPDKGNLALSAKASASSSRPEFPVAQVNDGDRKTSWSVKTGAKAGEWLRLDWPAAQTVSGIVIYPTGPYLASFDVEAATPAGWERLAHVASPDLPRLRRIALAASDASHSLAPPRQPDSHGQRRTRVL